MKDSPFYKMKPGSKEVDSPTAFSGKDQGTMSAFNYGSPMNNPDDKKSGTGIELDEVVLTAKSPQTIKKQVERNIAKAHPSAGNYRTASPERQKEIQAGKFTSGGSEVPLGSQDIRIYNRLKGKK